MQSTTLRLPPPAQVAMLLFVLVGQLGCDPGATGDATGRKDAALPAPAVDEPATAENTPPKPIEVAAGKKPWIAVEKLPWEAWYLQYLDGQRIGYSHVLIDRSALEGNEHLIRIYRTDGIEVMANGQTSFFQRSINAIEYADGRLDSMVDVSQSLDNIATTEGQLAQNTFTATTTVGEEVTTTSLTWEPGAWGVMGLQAILMQHPPQPGELLKAKVFIPQLYKIANAELLAGQPELLALPDGKTESLLPVDVSLWTEDSGMRSRNWINAQGEVLKTISLSGPQLITFWVKPAAGERVRDEFELEGYLQRRVELAGGTDLSDAHQVVYSVARNAAATGAEVYSLLAKDPQQTVESINALSAQATVQAFRPEQLEADASQTEEAPAASYRTASSLIPAEDPQIKQFAEELNQGQAETASADANVDAPAATALRITRNLHEKLKLTPLDRVVANAFQTIRLLQGDSVDQAILLTSLLRSQGLSARVVSGLVIDPENTSQMRFAMWTEAWLAGQWVPLDATTGRIAAADRLKFSDSALQGENPYAAILPVFRELEGLEIKVISHH